MPNNHQAQQKNKINNPTNKTNSFDVIQKHHNYLHTTFSALKSSFPEVNTLNYNVNKDDSDPNGIIEKLHLLFHQVEEAEKKLQNNNRQQPQFFTDIVNNIKVHCLAVYKDLHLLFIDAKDLDEKKDLIESAFLVGKILDYYNGLEILYKASLGLIPVTCQEINLKELVDTLITNARPIASYKQLQLDFKLAIDMPDLIISDQYRLQSILEYLIKDAVKSSNKNSIFLTINFFKSDQGKDNEDFTLQIIFRSTGLILAKEEQEALKDRFISFSRFFENKSKTVGSGLALVKQFIYDLNGEIEVTSNEKGTGFFCYIPVKLYNK
ncbi:HAMP domain-containing sensor histidine kinase [Rickettsia endosymbiont of Aspidapion aeneum]|uniref:sensor histidine kinase n=2 Tax=unclassified Rickettsia TaxID=114295 RepID=UPI00313F21FA